jgi:hypothetical protein
MYHPYKVVDYQIINLIEYPMTKPIFFNEIVYFLIDYSDTLDPHYHVTITVFYNDNLWYTILELKKNFDDCESGGVI